MRTGSGDTTVRYQHRRLTRGPGDRPRLILSHPELQGLRRWMLATRDAHEPYSGHGFDSLERPEIFMERELDLRRLRRELRPLLAPPQALPTSVCEPAAVHGQGMSVDEAAPFRIGKEGDGPGNVLRSSETGHWDAPLDVRVGVAATGLVLLVHLRLHPAGAYCVDANAASSPLGGEGAGQPDQTMFARVVSRPVGNAEQPRYGGDVHDAPGAPLEHHLAELPAHEERPGQVHSERPFPFCEGHLLRWHDGADAGVVH